MFTRGQGRPRAESEAMVLALLTQCAERGAPCPTNIDVARHIGCGGTSHASSIMTTLELRGLIRIERGTSFRVVTIVATGQRTAGTIGKIRSYGPRGPINRVAAGHPAKKSDESGPRAVPVDQLVARDPCMRCGTRRDVGCRHQAPVEPWRI